MVPTQHLKKQISLHQEPAIAFLYKLHPFRPTWRLVPLVKPGPFDLAVPGTSRAHTSALKLPWICIVVLVHWMLILPFSDVQHSGNTGHDEGPGWETQPRSGILRLWTYICHFIPCGGPSVVSDPREGSFPVLPLSHDTMGCFAEPSASEVLETYFLALTASSFLVSLSWWERWQRVCIIADLSQRKTSSSTQNISLISAAFICHLVSLSWDDCLEDSPAFPFALKLQKPVVLWNRSPEFLPSLKQGSKAMSF